MDGGGDGRSSLLTMLGLGVLTCNLLAFGRLQVLGRCWRGRSSVSGRIKAAVWALAALLTGMFAYVSMAAPLMPLVAGALVFLLCLRELERAQIGLGGWYADLVRMALGVVACDSALAHHHRARGDGGSLAFVLVAYAGFLTLTWLFLRRTTAALVAPGSEARRAQRPK